VWSSLKEEEEEDIMDSYSVEHFDTYSKNPIVMEIKASKSGQEDKDVKQRTVFYPMSLPLHTDKPYWIEMRVLLSKWNQKPYVLMKIPPSLKGRLQSVNAAMMDQLKSHFPEAEIRPWISDEQDWIRFSMTRLDRDGIPQSGLHYLDMEEPGIGTTRIMGGSGIQERVDRKDLFACLVFEFHVVYKNDNVVGFTPRLLKLIDYTPTASMVGFNSE
jgi:hypothetical protein